jgi:hypothetical protein
VAGAESHAAQGGAVYLLRARCVDDMCFLFSFCSFSFPASRAVWVCTAALAILDRLDVVDVPTLGWWLAERQLPNGGLNGRPEKLEDVHIISCNKYIYVVRRAR